jgi:hypothetical protein
MLAPGASPGADRALRARQQRSMPMHTPTRFPNLRGRPEVSVGAALLGCLVLASMPVALVDIPPLYDYYFHIARFQVLAEPDAPYIEDFYDVSWAPIPNLGMDLVVALLTQVISVERSARVFIVLVFVLLASGTLALHHALHRAWRYWPLVACLFLYNWMLAFGFANYLFGVGVALWCMAGWFHVRRTRPAPAVAAATALFAGLLYIAHLYAFALFAVFVVSCEAQALWASAPSRLARPPARRPAVDPCAAVAALHVAGC